MSRQVNITVSTCDEALIVMVGGRKFAKRAPFREVDDPPLRFFASLARRIDRDQNPQEALAV